MADKPRGRSPLFPPNRIIREDESIWCRTCGSGRHAHRRGGERADHPFNPLPFLERLRRFVAGFSNGG